MEKGAAALRVSPGEVEAEEGFAELALLQQVLQQRGETADGNAGVSQAQNPIEVQVVEGSAGLVQAQAELLVPEDDVLDLEGEGRCWEVSGFGGKIKSALGEAELFPIARGVGSSLTPSFVPLTLFIPSKTPVLPLKSVSNPVFAACKSRTEHSLLSQNHKAQMYTQQILVAKDIPPLSQIGAGKPRGLGMSLFADPSLGVNSR